MSSKPESASAANSDMTVCQSPASSAKPVISTVGMPRLRAASRKGSPCSPNTPSTEEFSSRFWASCASGGSRNMDLPQFKNSNSALTDCASERPPRSNGAQVRTKSPFAGSSLTTRAPAGRRPGGRRSHSQSAGTAVYRARWTRTRSSRTAVRRMRSYSCALASGGPDAHQFQGRQRWFLHLARAEFRA